MRRDGSYIYEEFVETQGTDVKMYTVGTFIRWSTIPSIQLTYRVSHWCMFPPSLLCDKVLSMVTQRPASRRQLMGKLSGIQREKKCDFLLFLHSERRKLLGELCWSLSNSFAGLIYCECKKGTVLCPMFVTWMAFPLWRTVGKEIPFIHLHRSDTLYAIRFLMFWVFCTPFVFSCFDTILLLHWPF